MENRILVKIEGGEETKGNAILEQEAKGLLYRGESLRQDGTYIIFLSTEDAQKLKDEETKQALNGIDMKSIRAIREWIVKQPDAPLYLKDYDAQAAGERMKLK